MSPDTAAARPTVAQVDAAAITANVRRLAEVAGTDVCAVVKADGYGHGAVTAARAALEGGATWLAVALVEEGEQLRAAGIAAPLLLLSEPPPAAAPRVIAAELTPMVYGPEFVAALDLAVARAGVGPWPVHLKLDTGMGRVGVPRNRWTNVARDLAASNRLRVEALATHLACADEDDPTTTEAQLVAFAEAADVVTRAGLSPSFRHAANTAATLRFEAARLDMVRPGIGVYGLSPSPSVDAADHGLHPALAVTTRVSYAKRVTAGTAVSYGHRWAAPADGWLATLPVGYADGVPRALTNRADVLIGGRRCPVAGTVCMDQVLAWCGDRPVAAGDEVVLLGRQGDAHVRVEDWAEHAGTITYEIVTQLTSRLPRADT